MAAVVERALLREGIGLQTDVTVESAEPQGAGGFTLTTTCAGQATPVQGSHLLIAAGRRPDTAGLGLDAAGIEVDERGATPVDRGLKTANARIYAIGACAGGAAREGHSRHGAHHQAGLVIRNALFRLPVKADDAAIPRLVLTDPELAVTGLSEEEARARHKDIRILRWPFADNERARAEGATDGHVKAVVTGRGRILGCAIAGPRAGELIAPWVLALSKDLKISDLAGLPVPSPTLSEATRGAAVEFLKPATRNPWVRRVIHWARFLGASR
jgi:pyruvate/2-oxoglutarate dehydrogenase complex dihydrolipoamide dehydrogenase (E3) component